MAGWRDLLAMLLGWHSAPPPADLVAGPYYVSLTHVHLAGAVSQTAFQAGPTADPPPTVYLAGSTLAITEPS